MQVNKLIERVEVAFIKHFANANRSKGMNILRPKKKQEKHRITFSMGKIVPRPFCDWIRSSYSSTYVFITFVLQDFFLAAPLL